MSGREHEPVASFFPSIDRNLIRDLDRHLRTPQPPSNDQMVIEPASTKEMNADPLVLTTIGQPGGSQSLSQSPPSFPTLVQTAPTQSPPLQARPSMRPNIASVLEAVEHAAHSMASMTARIEELEQQLESSEAQNRQTEMHLADAEQRFQQVEAKLKLESDRAGRFESVAGQQAARTMELERELMSLHADLVRVSEAVANALGYQEWAENIRA